MKPAQRPSLYDIEDEDQLPSVRDMIVGPVTTADVKEFTARYHYSQHAGSALWRYGLWHGAILHGIVAYNLPTRDVQESVFGEDHADHVIHMGRMALADRSPHNSESRLIGGSLHAITRDQPDVWAVLTYAAISAGHIGTIYQATNAIYTGTTKSIEHDYYDRDGNLRSRRSLYEPNSQRTIKERATAAGWTWSDGAPKHRYVYILGSKTQRRQRRRLLRFDVLPYPNDLF